MRDFKLYLSPPVSCPNCDVQLCRVLLSVRSVAMFGLLLLIVTLPFWIEESKLVKIIVPGLLVSSLFLIDQFVPIRYRVALIRRKRRRAG